MINGLEGIPGSGKSYEAVAFHILPALKAGRKVITNLPLNVEMFAAIDPAYRDLIELREQAAPVLGEWDASDIANQPAFRLFEDGHQEEPVKTTMQRGKDGLLHAVREKCAPFESVWCYYSIWRNQQGLGPLFVVDECHISLERLETSPDVVEWFKIHRHYNADVLLITQSFRDINQPIARLIATLIRCRKADILGNKDEYIRKVHAGYRGALIQTDERKYESKYFGLYKSNTQSGGGAEATATDVNPFIKKFYLFRNVFLLLGTLYIIWAVYDLFFKSEGAPEPEPERISQAKPDPVSEAPRVHQLGRFATEEEALQAFLARRAQREQQQPVQQAALPKHEPKQAKQEGILGSYKVHMTGSMVMNGRAIATVSVSDGSRVMYNTTTAKLEQAGYIYHHIAHCAGWLEFDGQRVSVLCDAPINDGGRDTPIVMNAKDGTRSDRLY